IASGPQDATLGGAATTTGSTGAAAFGGLAISGPTRTYTLSFGASGLSSATSGPIALNAASTTTAITTHTPNPSVTGQGIAVAFTVERNSVEQKNHVAQSDGAGA